MAVRAIIRDKRLEANVKRVTSIKAAGEWCGAKASDRVLLDADDRQRRRIVMTSESGLAFLLDEPSPVMLRDGDGLLLDDGAIVRVSGMAEPLIEAAPPTPPALIRLAWHLGNRHIDIQLVGGRIRIRRDHVLRDMLEGLGATVAAVDAPFEPEAGAPVQIPADGGRGRGV